MMVSLSSGEYRALKTRVTEHGETIPAREWYDGLRWYVSIEGVLVNPSHVVTMSGWSQ